MAKLELPARAFIEDFVTRAFPDIDWSRGSAANDLVIKAFSAVLQPLRHEIDVIKVNQSMANWQFMRQSDLDAIAANWGKFRQTGGLSIGTVRIVFNAATDYQFNTLEFFASDGTTYVLSTPVRIAAADLFTRRLSDGTFFFDVTVQSVGVGSRYALPAGSIVGIRNKPQGVVSVSNPSDFQVTAPDESNFDVVNAMYKNLGMRNLVSRQSIRAPILDTFPGVIDIFIAGVGHPNMLRDLVTVQLPTGGVLMHLGGMTDVWLNTTSISKRQTLISYVPSSLEIKIVSAEQAQTNELIFAFTRGQFSVDGLFSNPDLAALALDESTSVAFDVSDVPISTLVLGLVGTDRVQLSSKDLLSGTEMLNIVGPAGITPYVGDLTNLNFGNTDVQPDDYVLMNNTYRRITQVSGRLLDLAPSITNINNYLYVGPQLQPGTRAITLPQINLLARINDRIVLPDTAAAGEYTVLGLAANLAYIGKHVAAGQVTYIGVDPLNPLARVYHFQALGGTRPELPPDVGTSHFLYFGADTGYDQTKYFQILSLTPGTVYTAITVLDPAGLSPGYGTNVGVVQGLAGILPSNSLFSLQRDNGQPFNQDQIQSFAVGHSTYANAVPADVLAGTNVLESLGIGAVAAVGDIIEFVGLSIPTAVLPQTGGDGSRITVSVIALPSTNKVTFQPSLPFDIPAGTPFAVIRNTVEIASAVATVVDNPNNDFTIASMPLGLGDAQGLIVQDPTGGEYVVTSATAGNVRTLQFKPAVGVRTLVFSPTGYVPASLTDKNKPVQQNAALTSNGVLFDFNNATRTWLVIPNTPADTFADTTAVNVGVVGGTGAGQLSAASTGPTPAGYVDAVVGDLGSIVRQGAYTGVLAAYNNALFQWKVKPLSDADLFDSTTVQTFVDTGSGVPTPLHGAGTLLTPAGPVQIGAGPVTLSLSSPPGFSAGDTVKFFSRFGRNAGMFDGQNFVVSSNPLINLTPFAGVAPVTHQLAILTGDNAGIYDIAKVGAFNLQLVGGLSPEYTVLPNAPAAQPIINAVPLTIGTTTFAQTGVGIWGAPGRAIKIVGPGGTRLFLIASINNANSVELENPGLPFSIYPNSGFTWQVVEALHTPYWIIAAASKKAYRIFRVPPLGDLLEASSLGGFTNVISQQDIFTDNAVNFSTLLANADFFSGDYVLFVDSGSQASSIPIVIKGVTGTNTIQLQNTVWPVSEDNVSYRIVRVNAGRDNEDWIEASVVAMADPKTELLLDVPNGFDFARYGSHASFDVTIVPHPAWTPPLGWTYGTDWVMAKFTASYAPLTKLLTVDNTAGHWTFTAGDAFNQANGFHLPAGSKVRISIRMQNRASAAQLGGSALNTFNYYADTFFSLPVVKIADVQVLDPTSLQPTRSVPFQLRVDDKGLRYSARETNVLVLEDPTVALLPLAITYITDTSISAVDAYLNQPDTKIVNANQLAKRMETFSISVTISVRTTLTANEVASQIASFINSRRSTQPLTKADIIKDLFSSPTISYIDLNTFVMSGTYYLQDGSTQVHPNVEEVFGAETASYLADNISVTTL